MVCCMSVWLFMFCRIFRDVPSDITIQVNGGAFSLHKVTICVVLFTFTFDSSKMALPTDLSDSLYKFLMQ